MHSKNWNHYRHIRLVSCYSNCVSANFIASVSFYCRHSDIYLYELWNKLMLSFEYTQFECHFQLLSMRAICVRILNITQFIFLAMYKFCHTVTQYTSHLDFYAAILKSRITTHFVYTFKTKYYIIWQPYFMHIKDLSHFSLNKNCSSNFSQTNNFIKPIISP